jgi:hypothetical protein
MSLDAYQNSFLRVISVIIEILNYPFKLWENAFQASLAFLPHQKKDPSYATAYILTITEDNIKINRYTMYIFY